MFTHTHIPSWKMDGVKTVTILKIIGVNVIDLRNAF